jgi:hypothetical protein
MLTSWVAPSAKRVVPAVVVPLPADSVVVPVAEPVAASLVVPVPEEAPEVALEVAVPSASVAAPAPHPVRARVNATRDEDKTVRAERRMDLLLSS